MPFQSLESLPSRLKAGIYGAEGSGKTSLMILLLAEMRKLRGDDRPIAILDTEGRIQHKLDWIIALTGKPPLVLQTRNFAQGIRDLDDLIRSNEASGIGVDSATHLYENRVNSYMAGVNQNLEAQGRPPRDIDWLTDSRAIKNDPKYGWCVFVDLFSNSDADFVVCGREAEAFGRVWNEEKGKVERSAVGTRMKAEAGFGYEAVLLVNMDRVHGDLNVAGRAEKITHRAHILKDNLMVLQGASFDDPQGPEFHPHLTKLLTGKHIAVDTSVTPQSIASGDTGEFRRERIERDTLLAEIIAKMQKHHPGATGRDVSKKIELTEGAFGVSSSEALRRLGIDRLRAGYGKLLELLNEKPADSSADTATEDMREIIG